MRFPPTILECFGRGLNVIRVTVELAVFLRSGNH